VYQRHRHFTAVATNSILIPSQSRKLPLQFTIYPPYIVTPENINRYEAVASHLHSCTICIASSRVTSIRLPH